MVYSNSIYHHGVKGQKWGKRRYQNKDGSLTVLGRLRVRKNSKANEKEVTKNTKTSKSEEKKKTISEMSDDEIRNAINRKRLEKEYAMYYPEKVSTGKKFMQRLGSKVVQPALEDAGKKVLTDLLVKVGTQAVSGATKQATVQQKK